MTELKMKQTMAAGTRLTAVAGGMSRMALKRRGMLMYLAHELGNRFARKYGITGATAPIRKKYSSGWYILPGPNTLAGLAGWILSIWKQNAQC